MMDISKTTFNFAKKRGIELELVETNDRLLLAFYEAANDCEWMFSYAVNHDCLSWGGNVYLSNEVKEELPATITTEKKLREVIDFISKSI